MSKSILSRPLDLAYFIYFVIHIFATLAIDGQLYYPPQFVPQLLKDTLRFYLETYKDPFMGSSMPLYWFRSFVLCELLVQLPFFFIACHGLLKDSKYIRLPLAIFGAHVSTTVLPCIVEVLYNQDLQLDEMQRLTLCGFYAPYFVLPIVMVIDSYRRINHLLTSTAVTSKKTQ